MLVWEVHIETIYSCAREKVIFQRRRDCCLTPQKGHERHYVRRSEERSVSVVNQEIGLKLIGCVRVFFYPATKYN